MKTWTQRVAQIALVSTGLLAVGAGLASAATEPTGATGGDQVTKPVTDSAAKAVATQGAATSQATTQTTTSAENTATTGATPTDPATGTATAAKPAEGGQPSRPVIDPATGAPGTAPGARPADGGTAAKPVEAKPASNNNSPTKALEDAMKLDALTELTKKLTSRAGSALQQRSGSADGGFGGTFDASYGDSFAASFDDGFGDGFGGYDDDRGDLREPSYESVFESYQAMAMADAYQNLSSARPAHRPAGEPAHRPASEPVSQPNTGTGRPGGRPATPSTARPGAKVTTTGVPASSKRPSQNQMSTLGEQKLPSTEQVASEVVKGVPLTKELSQHDLSGIADPAQVDKLADGVQQVDKLGGQVPLAGDLTRGGLGGRELDALTRQLPGSNELRRLPTGDLTRRFEADALTGRLDLDKVGRAVRAIADETRGGTFTRPAELTGAQSLRSLAESGLVEKTAAGAQELTALDQLGEPVQRVVRGGVPGLRLGGQ
ncbi:hypothetical protein LX15_005135 [Streptoalloteichus tenebrarius]|uniref:Uncharacterized protein n=1 Tax=Streptoalloteichus tenebrarius (strain ATCC 17920 / DSM 40477 / JCM 4838 / CBS 697.72 / NBRC 16177 / NCIMB 11028 / NRRL B-12390 / A12253. 1 / ISP 5477) TaxID=1933 RepID=A0ABT1I0W7_STRSD|nr:hypothetical protein [Streptoalloteichus tenebrarius]MCP2261409.1 hypothetical protein [Streptoalloteichus tenebrarius]BFF02012.1 hypothetical protein GCM10020241_36870 [Streptoalloteichus tenebrarius]